MPPCILPISAAIRATGSRNAHSPAMESTVESGLFKDHPPLWFWEGGLLLPYAICAACQREVAVTVGSPGGWGAKKRKAAPVSRGGLVCFLSAYLGIPLAGADACDAVSTFCTVSGAARLAVFAWPRRLCGSWPCVRLCGPVTGFSASSADVSTSACADAPGSRRHGGCLGRPPCSSKRGVLVNLQEYVWPAAVVSLLSGRVPGWLEGFCPPFRDPSLRPFSFSGRPGRVRTLLAGLVGWLAFPRRLSS